MHELRKITYFFQPRLLMNYSTEFKITQVYQQEKTVGWLMVLVSCRTYNRFFSYSWSKFKGVWKKVPKTLYF